jgi:peptide/nickel transport system ATP-binding protein
MRYIGGRVLLDGSELPIWDDRRMDTFRFKEVSLIPQYALSALNPTRRIGKMVRELLSSRDVALDAVLPELRRRLDLVGLPQDVLERFPIELSGGMKQRVVMVISSLLDPSLLIADEVTSALDVSTQRAVAELLVEFRDRGFVKSMIVITHDLSVLYQIADTVLVMYAGKLAEKAPAEAIVVDAKHPYTDLLLSTLPEVGVRLSDKRLHGIPGRPPSLLRPPTGCRFRTRCPFAFERCAEEPPLVEVEPGRSAACWNVVPASKSAALHEVAGC